MVSKAVKEAVLFSRNVKPGMLEVGMMLKENFLTYSTQFVFLTIRLVPGNVVMVSIDMCEKSSIKGCGYMKLHENMCILIFPFFLL